MVLTENGLLLSLSSLWRLFEQQHGSCPADVMSAMLHLLTLCCGDGSFGSFAQQVVGASEFIMRALRAVMALPPEALAAMCEGGVLTEFCAAAATLPKLRELLRAVDFGTWCFRMGIVSQPDVAHFGGGGSGNSVGSRW